MESSHKTAWTHTCTERYSDGLELPSWLPHTHTLGMKLCYGGEGGLAGQRESKADGLVVPGGACDLFSRQFS
jgi:hypothetical protein